MYSLNDFLYSLKDQKEDLFRRGVKPSGTQTIDHHTSNRPSGLTLVPDQRSSVGLVPLQPRWHQSPPIWSQLAKCTFINQTYLLTSYKQKQKGFE